MTTKEQLLEALTDVRKAYRLVYAYQRRLFDLMNYLDKELIRSHIAFEEWDSAKYRFPSKARSSPVYRDCWAWDLIPGYWPRFSFQSQGRSPHVYIDIEVPVDSGFSERVGEPDPSNFIEASEAKSELWAEVWTATAPLANRTDAYGKLVDKHAAATLDGGETVRQDLGGNIVSYTLLRVDLAELADETAVREKLVEPLLRLVT